MKFNPVVHFEIYVDDMPRAEANGGSIQQPKMSIGTHGFCAVVRDCEGNLIGLHLMT
ncbi:putative enzyme related to lactoylglutathione lyase [Rheinheimera pacifica]|uniref:VOC family protein n=1 Tax=Rheinheimera pacifica TaxID=173990 RepID=UPI002168AEF3|nr:hypothetical protein [Rheinheimera pacifica]MCS4306209.1 putative enzyme related to lactoylglutathione lyase [Rheinheimera pacifica]